MAASRDRLAALIAAEPRLNQVEIAERLGISKQRVGQLVRELKLSPAKKRRGRPVGMELGVGEDSPPYNGRPVLTRAALRTSPSVAIYVAASDLVGRGYAVFLPITGAPNISHVDIVAIDRAGKLERIGVSADGARSGENGYARRGLDRRALVRSEGPVQYTPAFREKK